MLDDHPATGQVETDLLWQCLDHMVIVCVPGGGVVIIAGHSVQADTGPELLQDAGTAYITGMDNVVTAVHRVQDARIDGAVCVR